jgi:hypothetical protein
MGIQALLLKQPLWYLSHEEKHVEHKMMVHGVNREELENSSLDYATATLARPNRMVAG